MEMEKVIVRNVGYYVVLVIMTKISVWSVMEKTELPLNVNVNSDIIVLKLILFVLLVNFLVLIANSVKIIV